MLQIGKDKRAEMEPLKIPAPSNDITTQGETQCGRTIKNKNQTKTNHSTAVAAT